MHALPLMLAGLLIAVSLDGPAHATGCRRCTFAGLCFPAGDGAPIGCSPTDAGCVPYGGIVLFNSVPPLMPVYWSLRARRGSVAGRLVGTVSAFTDRAPTLPNVPGFPWRCLKNVCFAHKGRFVGSVTGDRFSGTSRYRAGGSCDFTATLEFGLGSPESNSFVCRDAAGVVTSQGALQLQGIRLTGCAQ